MIDGLILCVCLGVVGELLQMICVIERDRERESWQHGHVVALSLLDPTRATIGALLGPSRTPSARRRNAINRWKQRDVRLRCERRRLLCRGGSLPELGRRRAQLAHAGGHNGDGYL